MRGLRLPTFEDKVIKLRQQHQLATGGSGSPEWLIQRIFTGEPVRDLFRPFAGLLNDVIDSDRVFEDRLEDYIIKDIIPPKEELSYPETLKGQSFNQKPFMPPSRQEVSLDSLLGLLAEDGTVAEARKHCKANKAGYIALALADAFERGVDINLGTTYTAQED